MAQLNRRSFLKLLSVSPAIFHASKGFGKISTEIPKELLSDSELVQAATEPTPKLPQYPTGMVIISYPGKPKMVGGTAKYNPETDQTTHTFTQSGTLE
jgi:hypothetical protein